MTPLGTLARRGKRTKAGRTARRLAHLTFAAYVWTEGHSAPWFCRDCHHEPGGERGERGYARHVVSAEGRIAKDPLA